MSYPDAAVSCDEDRGLRELASYFRAAATETYTGYVDMSVNLGREEIQVLNASVRRGSTCEENEGSDAHRKMHVAT